MAEEGFASREEIDDGMRLGAGHPMGPLTMADMVGLDIVYSVGNSMCKHSPYSRWVTALIVLRRVPGLAGAMGCRS